MYQHSRRSWPANGMYNRKDSNYSKAPSGNAQNNTTSTSSGPWSVRAEFTIHRADTSSPVETTTRTASIAPSTESSGVRMTYSFTPSQAAAAAAPSYGFKRGNMTFTSIPPQKSLIPVRSNTIPRTMYSHRVQHEQHISKASTVDSGYASEQQVSRQPSDKRCRSTYSIVLSSAKRPAYPRPWTSYYQQNNSVYQQQQRQQHLPMCCHFRAALPELCENCPATTITTDRSTTTTLTTSKDSATQTTDIEAKMSPIVARKKVVRRKTPAVLHHGSSYRDELKSDSVSVDDEGYFCDYAIKRVYAWPIEYAFHVREFSNVSRV